MTHIAGQMIVIGNRIGRQRCSWCGELLIETEIASIEPNEKGEREIKHYETGAFVRVEGLNPIEVEVFGGTGDDLPDDSCYEFERRRRG